MTGNSTHILTLSGDTGLRNVQDIAGLLRQALVEHSTITVVTDTLTSIDTSIIQLLVSARKSALASGKTLLLRAPPDGALRRLLLQAGFVGADGTARTPEGEFWTGTPATEQPA
ncbi:STAS domain-containing protein [uncultured Devosia sp.]|uniref:STAS domain-containing protein n=1 Tax=uncultured Devosia sp. TaxID=211434 RepID=UPI0035C9732B